MQLKKVRFKRPSILLVAIMLVMIGLLAKPLAVKINSTFFVRGMTVGNSGSITPGSPSTSTSGIDTYAYKEPPIRVSLYRGKEAKLITQGGIDNIAQKMGWGFPKKISGSVTFLNATAYDSIGTRPVSMGAANTSNGTLTYTSDANAIGNIIRMGSTCNSGGVFYNTIKSWGLNSYKDGGWKTTSDWKSSESLGAWSWILRKDNGGYDVKNRLNVMFNPANLDYNNLSQYSQDQIEDLQMHYLDLLMTMYSVSYGDTKSAWGTAIDDYLNADNLDEAPVTVSIDCSSLINVAQSYFIVLPVIDYLNFYLGMEPMYALDGESWWSGAVPESYWYPKNTREQLRQSAQKSIEMSPNFARISDYYNGANKFSFISTAYTRGTLSTGGGVAVWSAPDHTLSDYLNIFYLDSPGQQDGYMMIPSPVGEPTLNFGAMKAEPDNKAIETNTLSQPVTLTISSGVADTDYGQWDRLVSNAKAQNKSFNVDITILRTSPEIPGAANISGNPSKLTWTPDELSSFIHGQKTLPYVDDTTTIATGGKKSITFKYTMTINIYLDNRVYTGTAEDEASFKVIEPRIGYDSRPEAYSELKNYGSGSNMSGSLSEDWEAMAGVPSTEQLYFAAGGSEFIVGITVERLEDEVSKRTYNSFYSGTDCEFKDGDTAKPVNFPSPSGGSGSTYWDPHAGGSYEMTWTGSIPNLASAVTASGSGTVTATCPAQPDRTAYNNAKAQAQAYVTQVNNTTFSWTAASDKKTRSKNQWGASITTDSSPNPQNTSDTQSKYHTETVGSGENQHTITVADPVSATASPSGATSYTIKVTWSIPAHNICGPCCSHVLPSINDSWSQTWTYDSMKIVDVHVWTIDQAAVDGLKKIISTDVVGAEVVKGRPNIFYNIALKNDPNYVAQDGGVGGATGTSLAGRVRYNLDSPQHDTVVYNNGVRTNKCDGLSYTYSPNVTAAGGRGHGETYATGFTYNSFVPAGSNSGAQWMGGQLNFTKDSVGYLQAHTDAKDKSTVEYNKFLSQRNAQVQATMITDFLILQTSSGDQAVMYFHKNASRSVTAETQIPRLDITKEEMWDTNIFSAAKWEEDHINVGSYNGNYGSPNSKFTVNNKGSVPTTMFDPDPAGTIKRPARPTGLMIYAGELNIILKDKNKSYTTGDAEVFWANTLHWSDRSSARFASVTDPKTTALFSTSSTKGPLTEYDFVGTGTEVGSYTVGNGLNLRTGTTMSGTSAVTDAPEEGVFGPYIPVTPGKYTVDVYGTGLTNGRAVIYTDYGATDWSDRVTYSIRTSTHVQYTVSIPSSTSIAEFCWHSNNSNVMTFSREDINKVSELDSAPGGYILEAPYSKNHSKINNIIVQDPVSTQDLSLVSLPKDRDQRAEGTLGGADDLKGAINASQVCPRDPALCDFRVQNCTYDRDTVLANFNFDTKDSSGRPINSVTGNALTLPTGFSLSGGLLQAYGTRLAIPFSELELQYQSSTHLRVEADVVIPQSTEPTMLFSFLQYDLYIPGGQPYATINTGNNWERKVNKAIADGQRHHVVVEFNFSSADRARVIVDGVEGYTRENESRPVTGESVGTNLYIGSWGANNKYSARYTVDNLKVTRLAGTYNHTEDCYRLIMTHPSGLNAHQHSAACLDGGNSSIGAQAVINAMKNKTLSDAQIHDRLGSAYEPIMANSYGSIIHTWSGWSASNMMGFSALNQVSLSTSNGHLIAKNSGSDPQFNVPVDFSAQGITKIRINLDYYSPSTIAKLYWSKDSAYNYNESQSVNGVVSRDGYTADFIVRNNSAWSGNITSLRFDVGQNGQQVSISNISVYGGGSLSSNGSGSSNSVLFESGTPGSYNKVLQPGTYKLETWGAQGGNLGNSNDRSGGQGGYSTGYYTVNTPTTLYLFVGEHPIGSSGGYNGGGNGNGKVAYGSPGGGATDIRTVPGPWDIIAGLNSRILVAGGGGGYDSNDSLWCSQGGGLVSIGNQSNEFVATQTSGYAFGKGENGNKVLAGGGGGWYGGQGGGNGTDHNCGTGGSGYIGGVSNGVSIAGNSSMPAPNGGTQVGQFGNGYVKITSTFSPVKIEGNQGTSDNTSTFTITVNDIKQYWNVIPDKLPNGANNPIWACGRPFNIHVHDNKCVNVSTLQCDEPHHKGMHYDVSNNICWDPCNNDENHKKYKPTINTADGSFTPGNFVNMDYGFSVYFPNHGDFDNGEPYGIGTLTSQRGLGFTDEMDTTKWTKRKRIKFEYNVIYKDTLYKAGEWITLGDRGSYSGKDGSKYNESKWSNYNTDIYNDLYEDYYDFYCVLANYEAKSSAIEAEVIAVNCAGANDNPDEVTNKIRGHYSSLHGGSNTAYADVVGRLGNITIEDTGDYRFSNLFKTPQETTENNTPTNYGVNSGLSELGIATASNGKIISSGIGSGVSVNSVQVQRGAYRIDITGNALTNGKISVITAPTDGSSSQDWSGDKYIKSVVTTSTKQSYYLTTEESMNVDVRFLNNNASTIEVSTIGITRVGLSADTWVVDGIVRDVDNSNQNYYMTWSKDIRGLTIDKTTNYINTYSTLNWIDVNRIQMPVSADKNNIALLQNEPLLVGYPIYFDISSLGNYWWNNSGGVQVVPYYYALNVNTKEIIPVDAYFKYDEEYKAVNINGAVTPTWDKSSVYNYVITLDWLAESKRRNYTDTEKRHTDFFRDFYAEGQTGSNTGTADVGDQSLATVITPRQLNAPAGSNYILGNGQLLTANGKARTFIGGETTYGKLMNLGGSNKISTDEDGYKYNEQGRIPDYEWWQSAQRWHLKVGVPSSTVFIRNKQKPDVTNIKEFTNDNYLILCTADIRVMGDTYILKYTQPNDNGSIRVQSKDGSWGSTILMPNNIPPVLAVYATTKTSKYDVDIQINH